MKNAASPINVLTTAPQSYGAWGKLRFSASGASDTNDTIVPQYKGYTNQEEQSRVQLINLNARTYDPYLGVMTSVDPAVANWLDPQTWNAYAYARDNPMAYTDPNGMEEEPVNGGKVG